MDLGRSLQNEINRVVIPACYCDNDHLSIIKFFQTVSELHARNELNMFMGDN